MSCKATPFVYRDDNLAIELEQLVTSREVITTSGRQVKAWTRFYFRGRKTAKTYQKCEKKHDNHMHYFKRTTRTTDL